MRAIAAALAAISLLATVGCSPADNRSQPKQVEGVLGMVRPDTRLNVPSREANADAIAPAATTQVAPAAVVLPMLAYAYSYRLELPANKTDALLTRHQETCEAAGPALCQVVSARSNASGRDHAHGQLVLQAQPAWLKTFRANLARDAEGAGGRILDKETEAEDLTRSIVDTEATIRAATALQTRLERLLIERPGNLQDALAIEQELARVRGTIDATRSSLEVMRGRVATSKLTLSYVSRGVATPDGMASPLMQSIEGFLSNVAMVGAALVTLLSFLLLPILIAAPVVWWLVRRSRRRLAKPAPPPTSPGG